MSKQREYVESGQLAQMIESWLGKEGNSQEALADMAGISRRAISKVLVRERPYQTIWLADKIVCAIDEDLSYLDSVWRTPDGKS